MDVDGYVVDPTQAMYFEMRCSACGRAIDMSDCPINQHHACIGDDGRIPVHLDIDNYEERRWSI